ncbi:MAG: GNAT family N-acetyltransferase [Jatrophihabitantaceae bacterium]
MDIEIRQAGPDDFREIMRIDGVSFGASYTEQDFEDIFGDEPPNCLIAQDGGQLVGIAGDYRFRMTVPGGRSLEVPGVTWVSVLPTHRRRGVLRALMQHQLAGYAAAGELASVLTASEGGIYGRFGYGPSTQSVKVSINRRMANLRTPVDSSKVEFLPPEIARTRLPELHERWRAQQSGGLSRTESWWNHLFLDRESHRGGLSGKFYLVHPDGYLSYRVGEQWDDGHANNRCVIVDYRISTAAAHAALWQVLLGMDLFSVIDSWELPIDDPLALLLDDPRQLRIVAGKDGMWLRPIHCAELLAARSYRAEVEAVIDIEGERLLLQAGPDGAQCQPTDQSATVSFALAALGSSYLGAHRVHTLARAGQVRSEDAGLLERLDLAFSTDRMPCYGTGF